MISDGVVIAAFFSSVIFASVHLFSNRFYGYSEKHKDKMLSLFGGIAVAYVFLDLLPRLESTRIHLENVFGQIPVFLSYLAIPGLAFLGFMVFFVLEHFAIKTRNGKKTDRRSSIYSFGSHFISIALLNLVIGFILRFEAESGFTPLVLYTVALSLHFIILDNTMERHYKRLYVRFGRFLAGLMPIVGWGLSVIFPENPSEGYLLLALVLGVILFNAIKDEVPKGGGKESRLFVVGALLYSGILIAAAWLGSG